MVFNSQVIQLMEDIKHQLSPVPQWLMLQAMRAAVVHSMYPMANSPKHCLWSALLKNTALLFPLGYMWWMDTVEEMIGTIPLIILQPIYSGDIVVGACSCRPFKVVLDYKTIVTDVHTLNQKQASWPEEIVSVYYALWNMCKYTSIHDDREDSVLM